MNFSEEWDKLKHLQVGQKITTIRWNDYPETTVGKIVPIKLKGILTAEGRITAIEFTEIGQLSLDFIKQDTKKDMTFDRFMSLMRHWYRWKTGWNELKSIVNVYYIEIVGVVDT